MATDGDFFALYRRPEWQQKRLRVMEAAQFACQQCFAKDIVLNVHHRFYKRGAKPWEYEVSDLVCLCEPCHKEIHHFLSYVRQEAGKLRLSGAMRLAGYLQAIRCRSGDDALLVRWEDEDPSIALGVADYFTVDHETLLERADDRGRIRLSEIFAIECEEMACRADSRGAARTSTECVEHPCA